jgi:hypothetical protein
MAGNWDAQIKLLYAADDGTTFAVDTIKLDDPFDVIANVEVGKNLKEFAVRDELSVYVRNLSRLLLAAEANAARVVAPDSNPLNEDLKVDIGPGWGANAKAGDLLEVVATYRFDAGIHTNHSDATSQRFIVTA